MNRLRIAGYGLIVVGVGLVSFAAMLLNPSPRLPLSGLWWTFGTVGFGALLLGCAAVVLTVHERTSLLLGIAVTVAVACLAIAEYFNAPGWIAGASSVAMLVAASGFIFAEPALAAIRKFRSPAQPAEVVALDRKRISGLLFQANFVVTIAGLAASQFGIVSIGAVLTTAFVVFALVLVVRVRPERRSIIRASGGLVLLAYFITTMYVTVPGWLQDATSALVVIAVTAMLIGPDARNFLARRRPRT